ncbi:MAG: ABC-F family ATP-binding cassette domain-containing protein [Candidatus Tectimicrobiota bacterium]
MTLLRTEQLVKTFVGVPILQEITWQIEAGRKIGLIGANGSGKSTLLNILSGAMAPDSGLVERARGLRLGYLTQEMAVEGERTLFEEVREAFRPLLDMQDDMLRLETHIAQHADDAAALQRYGTLLEEFNARQGYAITARVEATLLGLGFRSADLHTPVQVLSGGQKNMGALARVLLQEPDLLLLDEPSNHLDIAATEWLEDTLRVYRGTVVVISHDRYFLDRVVEEIVELEARRLQRYVGNYSAYVATKAARLEQQRKAYEQQQAEIRRQEDFIRRNMAGQNTKQAQSRQKALERLERLDRPAASQQRVQLHFRTDQRESHEVLVCRHVHKAFGGRAVLRGLSCTIYRGEKVGLMGPNGAGKSTFLRLLMGYDTPDEGTLRLGRNVTVAYYDQEMRNLHPQSTILDEVWQVEPGRTVGDMRSYLGRFLFSGEEVFQTIGTLSGGEKSRVALAKLMLSTANLLVMDEPTNHLDIPAREVLEEALVDYPGTLLLVSHDRYFLNRIITRLLYLRDGTCTAYPGNYADYQAHLAANAARTAAPPPAPKVKPVSQPGPRPRGGRRRKASTIEKEINQLEAELALLQETIAAHQSSADWQRLVELTTQQGTLTVRLESLMEEWEESMAAEGG